MTNPQKPLDEWADEKAKAVYEENAAIARKNRALTQLLRERDDELADLRHRLEVVGAFDEAAISPPKWLTPKAKKGASKHRAIPSMMLTDIHWGEVVDPGEINELNCYNPEIAAARIRRAGERAIRLCQTYLGGGVAYDGFSLMLGGDLVSGQLHEELRETDAATAVESVVPVMECLLGVVNMLADAFGRVSIEAVVGNHGRTTRKPRSKKRAKDNYDGLVYQLMARELKNDERVTMRVADGADAHFRVYETAYCLTHGDQFKGGSGISGALAPLMLGVHRKRRRDAKSGTTWDMLVMGHFHQSIFHQDILVSGAVIGYNEYAFIKNLPPENARAALWLTTPERGVTTYMPVELTDREAEGW